MRIVHSREGRVRYRPVHGGWSDGLFRVRGNEPGGAGGTSARRPVTPVAYEAARGQASGAWACRRISYGSSCRGKPGTGSSRKGRWRKGTGTKSMGPACPCFECSKVTETVAAGAW